MLTNKIVYNCHLNENLIEIRKILKYQIQKLCEIMIINANY